MAGFELASEESGRSLAHVGDRAKRVAMFCVLDCSPKRLPPIPVDSSLFYQSRDRSGEELRVVTVLVQGGLAKPNSFLT